MSQNNGATKNDWTIFIVSFFAIIAITTMFTYNIFGVTSEVSKVDKQLAKNPKPTFHINKK
jgi:hypothetical protein